jgi:hypothetical protein
MTGMKSSTIKSVLRDQLNSWISTINEPEVRELTEKNAFVTGGAISSMLLGEMPNDFDIYFKTKEAALAIATYYVQDFNRRVNNQYKTDLKLYKQHEDYVKQLAGYYESEGKEFVDTSKWPPKPVKPMHETLVKLEDRVNCKGVIENRIIVYAKSAGVVSETQSEYKYFEQHGEFEADDFMRSLKADEGVQSEIEYQQFREDPIGYTATLANEVKRPPGKPPGEIVGKFRPVFLSENAITLSHKMQLVVRFFGTPGEIHENYDFAHCMCWYDLEKDHLELPSEAMQCVLSKTLIYKGSLYPIASIFRIRKFIERGWRITAGQLLKIIWQISSLDLKDSRILREQLIGVDQAYMKQLLLALEKKDVKIDAIYIVKLIDEIFE